MITGYNCDFFVYCGKTESGEKCTESCAVLKQVELLARNAIFVCAWAMPDIVLQNIIQNRPVIGVLITGWFTLYMILFWFYVPLTLHCWVYIRFLLVHCDSVSVS